MRVFADTNIFIAYLWKPSPDSFLQLLLDNVVQGRITLLISEQLIDEIEQTIRKKKSLYNRIGEERLSSLIHQIKIFSELIPKITHEYPKIVRDRKDDYLIAYAVMGKADYLISLDKDLLVLKQFGNVKIVHSAEFRQILDS